MQISSVFVTVRQLRLISVGILETQCVSTTWEKVLGSPKCFKAGNGTGERMRHMQVRHVL